MPAPTTASVKPTSTAPKIANKKAEPKLYTDNTTIAANKSFTRNATIADAIRSK